MGSKEQTSFKLIWETPSSEPPGLQLSWPPLLAKRLTNKRLNAEVEHKGIINRPRNSFVLETTPEAQESLLHWRGGGL